MKNDVFVSSEPDALNVDLRLLHDDCTKDPRTMINGSLLVDAYSVSANVKKNKNGEIEGIETTNEGGQNEG